MKQSHSIFTEDEKSAIVQASKKPNQDFDYAVFLRLVAEAKAEKGYPGR